MPESIIVALITGLITLLGTVLTILATSQKQATAMDKQQGIFAERMKHLDGKMQDLTEEVKKHNGFAERIPVIEEKIKVANNRISDLESKVDRIEVNH